MRDRSDNNPSDVTLSKVRRAAAMDAATKLCSLIHAEKWDAFHSLNDFIC